MKALSLRQPYAELVVTGKKTIELRSWNTKHRDKFLVHASKYRPLIDEIKSFGLDMNNLEFGSLIGIVELVGTKDYDSLDESQWYNDMSHHLAGNNYVTSTKGFILKNPQKFSNPIPYKGQLNFFNVPDDIRKTFDRTLQRTTVVNIRDSPYDVFIGRPSKWGNPYTIGPDGNRTQVMEQYTQWIKDKKHLLADLQELQGKRLGCFCKPLPCHGDILLEILEEKS